MPKNALQGMVLALAALGLVYILMTGKPQPAPELAEPNHSAEAVLVWARQVIEPIMSLAPDNLEQKRQETRKYFTAMGHESFWQSLEEARYPEMMKQKHVTVSMAATGKPVMVKAEPQEGIYTWVVQMPATVSYVSAKGPQEAPEPHRGKLTLVIERSSLQDNEEGLGIRQWVMTPF